MGAAKTFPSAEVPGDFDVVVPSSAATVFKRKGDSQDSQCQDIISIGSTNSSNAGTKKISSKYSHSIEVGSSVRFYSAKEMIWHEVSIQDYSESEDQH